MRPRRPRAESKDHHRAELAFEHVVFAGLDNRMRGGARYIPVREWLEQRKKEKAK